MNVVSIVFSPRILKPCGVTIKHLAEHLCHFVPTIPKSYEIVSSRVQIIFRTPERTRIIWTRYVHLVGGLSFLIGVRGGR